MRMTAAVVALLLGSQAFADAAPAKKSSSTGTSSSMSADQKTFYALGMALADNLKVFSLTRPEVKLVERGLEDATLGRPTSVTLQEYGPKIRALAEQRMAAQAKKEKARDAAFATNVLKEPGAKTYPSGLIMIVLKPGKGPSPKATDTVKVDYEGKLTNGKVFDSSIARGQPAEFPLNAVIPCWTEAVQKMKVGETARLICPSKIAYGDEGRPPQIPGGATLDFKVTLLSIVNKKP